MVEVGERACILTITVLLSMMMLGFTCSSQMLFGNLLTYSGVISSLLVLVIEIRSGTSMWYIISMFKHMSLWDTFKSQQTLTHYVAKTGQELLSLPALLSICREYKHVLPHSVRNTFSNTLWFTQTREIYPCFQSS